MSSGKMVRDATHYPMQIFTTHRVQAVTNGVAWVPGPADRAFSITADTIGCIITNDSGNAQQSITYEKGTSRGISIGYTYTFDANSYIEVM